MNRAWGVGLATAGIAASIAMAWTLSVQAQGGATTGAPPRMPPAPAKSSYTPVVEEPFETVFKRMTAAKDDVMNRQMGLLAERYDLSDRPASGVAMSGGKAVQAGVRVKLPPGATWDSLVRMSSGRDPRQEVLPGRVPPPAPSEPSGGRDGLPEVPDRRGPQADRAGPDPVRSRLRPAGPIPARVPRADLPHHPAGSGRRLEGPARHDRQLLRAVQRHPESQADRGPAAPADPVPAAAVQPDRGPPQSASEPRRGVSRLPPERQQQRGDAPGRRHPAPGVPAAHRHPRAARPQHPAPLRLAAGAQDGGGLHRVRAARGLLRRRSGHRHQEGRQPARARQPGALHGRVPGATRLPAGAEARRLWAPRPEEGDRRPSSAARPCSSVEPSAAPATRPRTTPTTRCTISASSGSTGR